MAKRKRVGKGKQEDSHQVKIPDAVKVQGEKADELLAGGETPAVPEAEDVIVDNPSEDIPAEVKPKPEPTKAEPLPEDNQNWKHKYDVLQGMFNAKDGEIKSLQQGMQNLQNLVNHQAEQLSAFQHRQSEAPAAENVPVIDATKIKKIDLDSVAGYGDEIVYMAEGMNAQADLIQSLMSRLKNQDAPAQNNPRMDRLESMVFESAQEKFYKSLDSEVPKWREVTVSPEFQGWILGVDPRSGYEWKQMYDFAVQNLRAPQAASIIREFGVATGIEVGKKTVQPAPKVGNTNIVDQTGLSSQAMPEETTASDTGREPETYPTQEEVTQASTNYAKKPSPHNLEVFNEISRRFQKGLMAARKAQG